MKTNLRVLAALAITFVGIAAPASSQDEEHHARRQWRHDALVYQCGQLNGLRGVQSMWADKGTQDLLAQEWADFGCEAIQRRIEDGQNQAAEDDTE